MENNQPLYTNNPGINLFLFSVTSLGALVAHVTASNLAAVLTIILGIMGIINYSFSIKKSRLEIKKLQEETPKRNYKKKP